MWSETKILIPPAALERVFPASHGGPNAGHARNITARLNEAAGKPLPNEFFHYNDAGQPMGGRAHIRFGRFRTGFSIQGVGERGVDMVESLAHHVRRMWSMDLGEPLTEHRYSGSCGLEWATRPVNYYIQNLLIDCPKSWWMDDPDAGESIRVHLAEAIKRSVIAEIASVHASNQRIQCSDVLAELQDLRIEISSFEGVKLKQINPGTSNKAVLPCARAVRFSLPISLHGIWHVGRLSARGYGKVQRDFGNSLGEHADPFRKGDRT